MSQAGVSAEKVLLDGEAIQRSLARIAHEIVEANPDLEQVALVGIHTRGVPLAQRLRRLIAERTGQEVRLGSVDITFYRDDVQVRGGEAPIHPQPVVRATKLDFPLEGKTCVLVDDVLYTGRTIRAAIEALFDYGRPARVQLAVPRRPRPPRASDPSRLRRQEPADRARRARPGAARRDRRGRPSPAHFGQRETKWVTSTSCGTTCARPTPPPRRHLISIGDLTRDDVERLLGDRAHASSARSSAR